jgi:RNA polymerase subunit RPABC4/transcription elongation factor Spt4
MLPLAYFGIESSGLSLVIDLLILFVVVLYVSLVYWTYTDARRRILDPMLVGCATAASLFPFVGTIIYIVLRPPEYLEDVRERELEMQNLEERLGDVDRGLCPHCDYRVEPDFVRCPACLGKLKERCVSCQRPLEQDWAICPYCETEVPGAQPARRKRRRREIDKESLLIESPSRPDRELLLGEDSAPDSEGDSGGVPQRAVTPAARALRDESGTRPVAASEPAPQRPRSSGRPYGRPGSTS